MSYNSNPGRISFLVSNSGTIDYTFIFKIFEEPNIKVLLTPQGQSASDIDDLLVLNTDYTVNINGDSGGFIRLTNTPTIGDSIIIVRDLYVDRNYEYTPNGGVYSHDLNQDQDYQTYMISDNEVNLGRAMSLPVSVTDVSTQLPNPLQDQYLRWNEDGTALINDETYPTAVIDALEAGWKSEASRLTSDSYATEPEDVFVKITTSNNDGTYTVTDSNDYSAFHYSEKTEGDGILRIWDAQAKVMTADSYATEPENTFVKIYSSNGDGTYSSTNTEDYSAFHYSEKTNQDLILTNINVVTSFNQQKQSEAEKLTSDSYATENEDVPVKIYYFDTTSQTIKYDNSNPIEYSSKHYKIKALAIVSGELFLHDINGRDEVDL